MPVGIALSELTANMQSCLHLYWRIRAANATMLHFSQAAVWRSLPLEVGSVPATAELRPPAPTTVGTALHEIEHYVKDGRAVSDFFLSAISSFESFLSDVLSFKGLATDGTLGALINRAEAAYSIPHSRHTEFVAEVRERRNALIHHHGMATQRYVAAAVATSLPAHIRAATEGQRILIDDNYFTYACDGLVGYARQF